MNFENIITSWEEEERNIRMRLAKIGSINPSEFATVPFEGCFGKAFGISRQAAYRYLKMEEA